MVKIGALRQARSGSLRWGEVGYFRVRQGRNGQVW